MSRPLTEYVSWADARRHFSREALWALLDGDRSRLNIAHECVDRHARDGDPARTAVRVVGPEGDRGQWSFGELSEWSGRVAGHLAGRGVAPGDRVAIVLEPSLAFYATLFGAMKLGAVAVPMFTLFGSDALAARLDDCAPALVVVDPGKAGELEAVAGRRNVLLEVADGDFPDRVARAPRLPAAPTTASDMAMYQYTSGTTRELPEAVRHRHRAIVTVLIAALYGTGVRPGDRFCCPSSPAWGHGLWHGTLAPLALGVEITAWAGRFDPEALLAALERHRITNLSAAATHYRMMKNCGAAPRHRYATRKLSFTGEPMDPDTERFVAEAFGTPARSMYGTTEVGVILGGYPGAPDLPWKSGSLGKPMPGVEVAVMGPGGRPCPPGELGEIMVRRPDGWFPTKDLGRVDEEGWFHHGGRADDVIISAGWTLSPIEIEGSLLAHPDIDEVAAIGVPDPLRGQVVKVFVVSRRPPGAAFEEEIRRHARERLGAHEYPRVIEFARTLPKTPAGKVNRRVLRAREGAQAGTRTEVR